MNITRIEITNILGIEHEVIIPAPDGAPTVFEGANGTGKTSKLEAILGALRGGTDKTLLRNGAAEGIVAFTFDDGRVYELHIFEGKDATYKLYDPAVKGQKWNAREVVKAMIDENSIDPAQIFNAKPKDRVQLFMEAMPLELDVSDLANALEIFNLHQLAGITPADAPGHLNIAPEPLANIKAWRDNIYAKRTDINRDADKAAKMATGLLENLPADDGTDWAEATELQRQNEADLAAEAQEKRKAALQAFHDTDGAAKESRLAARKVAEDEYAAVERKAKAIYQKTIDAAAAILVESLEEVANNYETSNMVNIETYEKATNAINSEYNPLITQAHTDAAVAQANADAAAGHKANRKLAESQQAEAKEKAALSEAATRILGNLDKLKADLVATMPIAGVELAEDVYIDGVPFARVNTARKWIVLAQLCALRQERKGCLLKIVCADNLESLDAENYAAMAAAFKDEGFNFFGARVTA